MLQEHRNFRTPDLVPTAFSPTLPVDDMRLLHHWTAKLSFFHDAELGYFDRIWSVDVVEIAFQHPLWVDSSQHFDFNAMLTGRRRQFASRNSGVCSRT